MRLGLCSYAYRWSIAAKGHRPGKPLTTKQFILKAMDHGLDGVQLCDHLDFMNLSDRSIRELRHLMESGGMYIETGAGTSEPGYLRKIIDVSQRLGSHILRVVLDIKRNDDPENLQNQLARAIEGIGLCLDTAKQCEVKIALENHAQITSHELLFILRSLNDDFVGICLDTMNSIVLMENPLETARQLANQAITVHFKDFKIIPDPNGHRIIGVPLGEGNVDFQSILKIIKGHGLDPNINIELFVERKSSDHETLKWESECVQQSVKFARQTLSL